MRATPPGVDVRIVAHRGLQGGGGDDRALPRRRRAARSASPAATCSPARAARGGAPSGPRRSTRSCCPSPAPRSPAAPLDAALRLARAEDATLMPAYLAAGAEEPAAGVRDPERGGEGDADAGGDRTARHRARACRSTPGSSAAAPTATRSRACSSARASTASSSRRPRPAAAGFSGDDLVWLLEKAPAEVLILRPGPEDRRVLTVGANGSGRR